MSKVGSVVKGGAGGAVAGSSFGPYGAAIGGVGGAIYGWLSDTSDEQAAAEKDKLAGMQKAAGVYEGYRPQVAGARQQGLKQQLSAYNGAGNAMGLMYGNSYNPSSYAPDLGKLPDPKSYAPAQPAQPRGGMSQHDMDGQRNELANSVGRLMTAEELASYESTGQVPSTYTPGSKAPEGSAPMAQRGNPGRQRTGPANNAGYDDKATKALQAKTGDTSLWVDGSGGVHHVGETQNGIVSPF
jgi:hypothetical protein